MIAAAADAPWGFAWSQKRESLPRPSSVQVDANITLLLYEGATSPSTNEGHGNDKRCETHQYRQIERAPITVALRLASPLGCHTRVTTGCTVQPGMICAT
jgi:hypothetical protein